MRDLSNAHEAALERVQIIANSEIGFMNANIRDSTALDKVFTEFKPETVIHFIGLKVVGQSASEPLKYYNVNIGGSISLLEAMDRTDCLNIIFSPSAIVYGVPHYLPYDEKHPTNPVSPYRRTKLIIEEIIHDWVTVESKLRGTSLRYFNPVGDHPSGQIGEYPKGTPNNLMPFISQAASGWRDYVRIF
jgi:UDP-glucose 4-epimerase